MKINFYLKIIRSIIHGFESDQYIRNIFVLIILPGSGIGITAGLIYWKEDLQKYIEGFTAVYLIYFLMIWLKLDSSWTSTPFLNIPLGSSPVMLVLYTVFGIGMMLGASISRIRD